MFTRLLIPPKRSFFLFGPRATGKSTWLKHNFKNAHTFNLLENKVYFRLLSDPSLFRQQVLALPKTSWVIVDEVQKIPALLDEVHSLIEDHGYKFALTGSSARKLKRGQANLLAGRALIRNLFPLAFGEYRDTADIDEVLSFGTLPAVLTGSGSRDRIHILEAYSGVYLKEEIKEEALTRNIDSFGRFLEVAALANAQVTNVSSIARDAHVSRSTVSTYFEILEETLIGRWLPAWRLKARVKEVAHPKFYFFDCGVTRAIQNRLRDKPTTEEKGALLETYVFHELSAYMSYADCGGKLAYWRTPDGVEVDFLWHRANRSVAIEVKASLNWKKEFDKGLDALWSSKNKPQRSFGVYLGHNVLKKDWGYVLPIGHFLKKLWDGDIIH